MVRIRGPLWSAVQVHPCPASLEGCYPIGTTSRDLL
jgi:hypothetical protein